MNNILKKTRKYLKLSYDKIPNYIINFSLKNILAGNGQNYTDEEIETIIKAFCYREASKYIKCANIIVLPSCELDKISRLIGVNGIIKDNTVYLQRECLLKVRDNNVGIFRTIFHEITHARQTDMLISNEINYKTFLFIMEHIISNEMNDEYFVDNYKFFFEEVDARINSEFCLFDFLLEFAPHLLASEFEEIMENIESCEADANVLFRLVNKKEVDRESLLDRILIRNPKYLDIFPLLNFYYEPDGSKIPLAEIISRGESMPYNSDDLELFDKVKKLDYYIIKNRRGAKRNIERDINSLIELEAILESKEDIQKIDGIINQLLDCLNNNLPDNNISELYNLFLDRLEQFKNNIKKTKITANEIFVMVNKIERRNKNDAT